MTEPSGPPAGLRRLTFPAITVTSAITLAVSILIIATGGVVRVTGSGLGCPTWPRCDDTSLTTTAALGIHGAIEFGNRMLTGLLSFSVVALILAVLLQRDPAPRLVRRAAWAQLGLVVVNAVVGGITVLTGLNPWIVAGHFLAAIGLLTTTTLTWHRVREFTTNQTSTLPLSNERRLCVMTLVGTAVLVVAGTLATGSGPHSGDSAEVARMGLPWAAVTVVHGLLAVAVSVAGIVLWRRLRASVPGSMAERRAQLFLATLAFQALVGIVQSLTGLPSWLVVVHLLGASLVWVGAVRLALDTTSPMRATAARPKASAPAVAGARTR